jgi:hypothetical protein
VKGYQYLYLDRAIGHESLFTVALYVSLFILINPSFVHQREVATVNASKASPNLIGDTRGIPTGPLSPNQFKIVFEPAFGIEDPPR